MVSDFFPDYAEANIKLKKIHRQLPYILLMRNKNERALSGFWDFMILIYFILFYV